MAAGVAASAAAVVQEGAKDITAKVGGGGGRVTSEAWVDEHHLRSPSLLWALFSVDCSIPGAHTLLHNCTPSGSDGYSLDVVMLKLACAFDLDTMSC